LTRTTGILGAVAALIALVLLLVYMRSGGDRLDPPDVLLERVVHGDSVETQSQAARDMLEHGDEARPFARRALAEYSGNDPEVLLPLVQGIAKQRDWRSLPRLFTLMEHDDASVRGRAGAAVVTIMGADYGFHANDGPQERRKALILTRAMHKSLLPKLQKFYASQEE
jgi:hypothetical protein